MHYIASTQALASNPLDHLPTTGVGWFDTFMLMFLTVGIVTGIIAWFWNKFVGAKFKENIVDPIREFIYDVRSIKQKTNELAADTAAVKDNVVNHHPDNMRIEMDKRHEETMHAVTRIANSVEDISDQVKELHGKTDRIKERAQHTHNEIMGLRELQPLNDKTHMDLREHDNKIAKQVDGLSTEVHEIVMDLKDIKRTLNS